MQQAPIFAASLTPYRALSRRGIRVVIAIAAVLASIPGLVFFTLGAWPVVGFLGLDLLALWWAMSANLRSGNAFEEVTLWRHALELRHVTPKGLERRHSLNPFWVRLVVDRDDEERVTRIVLRNRGQDIELGAFLNPDDKASFAIVFGKALAEARA